MLAPPWICFGQPEGIEPGGVAGLRHTNGFVQRLHAELQHTDLEWHAHRVTFPPLCVACDYRALCRITPGMFEAFHQLPHGAIQRRWYSGFFAPISDGSVHEIDFGL